MGWRVTFFASRAPKGQRLQLDSLLAGTGTTWALYGPNNQAINSFAFIGTDFTVTLPASGEHYLILDGANPSSSVSYSFQAHDVRDPPPASPTTVPFTQSGTVVSGTPVDLPFTAAACRHLCFEGLTSSTPISAQILDPTGTSIFSINAGSDSSRGIFLPHSGTYALRLSGNGSYDFRPLDLQAHATALTLGTAVTEPLTPSNGARVFSFTGAVAQRLFSGHRRWPRFSASRASRSSVSAAPTISSVIPLRRQIAKDIGLTLAEFLSSGGAEHPQGPAPAVSAC